MPPPPRSDAKEGAATAEASDATAPGPASEDRTSARGLGSLTLGGLIGTGTTTACRALHERTGLPYVYAGALFREQAARRAMTLDQFGAYAEAHPEVDRDLDAHQSRLLRGAPLILEGRLSGFLAYRDNIRAFKVWFTCDPYERARRVVERESGDVDTRLAEMRRREESERKRYLALYGFDLNELSVYDWVLDTTELSKARVVDEVLAAWQRARPRRRWWWPFSR